MDKEGPRRRRDDAMSDAEFLAGYEARHGRAAMLVVARAMAMDPPSQSRSAQARRQKVVGVKPKPRPALGQNLVEINAVGGYRAQCRDCGRFLPDLPAVCSVSGGPH